MTAVFSPVGNGWQWFNTQGVVLSGGKINTYAAGSTTPQATYTDNTLGTPNANPIILDSSGRYAQEIWWPSGESFKFLVTDSSNNTIATLDNLVGINDVSVANVSEWVATNLTPTFISSTSFSLVGNQTSILTPGRRIKTVNTGGTVYSTIVTSAFTTLTTVTVVNDSTVLDSGLSAVSYGFLSSVNMSIPSFRGSWTPVITFATPGDLNVVYSTQVGIYTKIDNMVFLDFNVTCSTFNWTTSSGGLRVTGLPFTSATVAGMNSGGRINWGGITKTGYTDVGARVGSNSVVMDFAASGSGQAASSIVAADVPTGGSAVSIAGSIAYRTP